MTDHGRPIRAIIDMSRTIEASGMAGATPSKAHAEEMVSSLLGPKDQEFTELYGLNYWNYLKTLLSNYVHQQGLDDRFVVKGTPFHWHSSVGTKCGAVILRKGFFKGDQRVEPELYLEAGFLAGLQGRRFPGLACGFHYLPSAEGDRSGFVHGVLSNTELKGLAWDLSNDGFVNPSYLSRGAAGFWTMDAALYRSWDESALPSDVKGEVFRALDDLLPLFLKITSLPAP